MQSCYYYHIFGFSIQSDIRLPFLKESPSQGEVSVKILISEDLPNELLHIDKLKGVTYETSPTEFLFEMSGVARYFVKDGASVLIQPAKNSDEKKIAHFLMNPVLIALLHQRGMLPLRASAIEKNGKGILIAGSPVTGKSTLAAGLVTKGFKLIADELSVITKDENDRLFVHSFQPQLSLQEDVIDILGINPDMLGSPWAHSDRVREGVYRHNLTVNEDAFQPKKIPITCIYILPLGPRTSPDSITNLAGAQQLFTMLYKQMHLPQLKFSSRHQMELLQLISLLANQVTVKKFQLSADQNNPIENVNTIAHDVNHVIAEAS